MSKSTNPFLQLLVMLALSMILSGLAAAVPVILAAAGADATSRPALLVIETVAQLVGFVLPVALMVWIYYRGQGREFVRIDFSAKKWGLSLVAMVVMLLSIPVIDWLSIWNDGWQLGELGEMLRKIQSATEGMMDGIIEVDTVAGLVSNLIVVALVPAVCEELFFRAGIQNLLQRTVRNKHVAIWITAAIFSLAHGEIFSFMPRLLMGAMLGYMYVYGGSIVVNAVAHFVNNATIVVLCWLSARGIIGIDINEPMEFGVLVTVCCTIAAIVIFWLYFVGRKTNKA